MTEVPAAVDQVDQSHHPDEADEALIGRVSAERRTDQTTAKDVEELLRRAAEQNKAALDRLAE